MSKQDLVLNNEQWLICHKTKLSQTLIPQNAKSKSSQSGGLVSYPEHWLVGVLPPTEM